MVDAQNATRRLPPGALIEVDGATGEIRLVGAEMEATLPASEQSRNA